MFDSSPLIQKPEFNNFPLIFWFLCKNLSNFLPSAWKLHNPYCHSVAYIPEDWVVDKIRLFLLFWNQIWTNLAPVSAGRPISWAKNSLSSRLGCVVWVKALHKIAFCLYVYWISASFCRSKSSGWAAVAPKNKAKFLFTIKKNNLKLILLTKLTSTF